MVVDLNLNYYFSFLDLREIKRILNPFLYDNYYLDLKDIDIDFVDKKILAYCSYNDLERMIMINSANSDKSNLYKRSLYTQSIAFMEVVLDVSEMLTECIKEFLNQDSNLKFEYFIGGAYFKTAGESIEIVFSSDKELNINISNYKLSKCMRILTHDLIEVINRIENKKYNINNIIKYLGNKKKSIIDKYLENDVEFVLYNIFAEYFKLKCVDNNEDIFYIDFIDKRCIVNLKLNDPIGIISIE